MKDEKDGYTEMKMRMMKMRDEMLNSMTEKELRAFIKGYMMGERTAFKQLSAICEVHSESCQECSSCGCGGSCGCGDKDCKECNCEDKQ